MDFTSLTYPAVKCLVLLHISVPIFSFRLSVYVKGRNLSVGEFLAGDCSWFLLHVAFMAKASAVVILTEVLLT